MSRKKFQSFLLNWLPILFFAALLFSRASIPQKLIFDEINYVPAAKSLITLTDNLNWEHPPLAKFILGAGWKIFTVKLGLIPDPTIFRVVCIIFGLWLLRSIYAWMVALGFSSQTAHAATWLTGFNFLWFVQSKTVLPDIFYVAFASWGVLYVWRGKNALGWALLGLSAACKWSAVPFIAISIVLIKWRTPSFNLRLKRVAQGLVICFLFYFLAFTPLALLKNNDVPVTDFFSYHSQILAGQKDVSNATHPYLSKWWQWPTLIRPIWYTFDVEGSNASGVWAGGNPALFWTALPLLFLIAFRALTDRKKISATHVLALLYWATLLFWAIAPRKMQLFYYYLPASIWTGPIVVWGYVNYRDKLSRLIRIRVREWTLWGFVILCGALFFYFLPIMDGRSIPTERFLIYMWINSWI